MAPTGYIKNAYVKKMLLNAMKVRAKKVSSNVTTVIKYVSGTAYKQVQHGDPRTSLAVPHFLAWVVLLLCCGSLLSFRRKLRRLAATL